MPAGKSDMKKNRRNKKQPSKKGQKNRKKRTWSQLEKATTAYFASLSGEALEEENRLGAALAEETSQVNFDE
jgi:hypothetical protein